MANMEYEMLLRESVEEWNQWRKTNADPHPDLSRADLREAHLLAADLSEVYLLSADLRKAKLCKANLSGAKLWDADLRRADLREADLRSGRLSGADLSGADLRRADLRRADLSGVKLCKARLQGTDLSGVDLSGVDLSGADLSGADLSGADLSGADLSGADLSTAVCIGTNLRGADLTGCYVYGVSAWNLQTDEKTVQTNLYITNWAESSITVDNLEVAQFLYLLLHNEKIRGVLDTVMSKVVLILGRFSEDRLPALRALQDALQLHPQHYIPVLFDFAPQAEQPILATVKTLANLARFILADVTDPAMIRAELAIIIPNAPTVPVQPLLQEGKPLMAEFSYWQEYRSVLPVYHYRDLGHLLATLSNEVIAPAEAFVQARKL